MCFIQICKKRENEGSLQWWKSGHNPVDLRNHSKKGQESYLQRELKLLKICVLNRWKDRNIASHNHRRCHSFCWRKEESSPANSKCEADAWGDKSKNKKAERERERERDHVCVCCLIGIYRRGDGGGGILFCFCVVSRNLGTEEEGPTNLAREEIFYYLY